MIVGGATVLAKERSVSLLQKNGYLLSQPSEKQPGRSAFSVDKETFKPSKMENESRHMQVWSIALLSEGIKKQVQAGKVDYEISEEKWDCGGKGVAITFIAIYAGEKKVLLTADATMPRDAQTNATRLANAVLFNEEGSEWRRDSRTAMRHVSMAYVQKNPKFDLALGGMVTELFGRHFWEGKKYTALSDGNLSDANYYGAVQTDWDMPGTGAKYEIRKRMKLCMIFENGHIVDTLQPNHDFYRPPSWEVQSRMADLSERHPENPKFTEEFHFVGNWMNRDIWKYAIPICNEKGEIVLLL